VPLGRDPNRPGGFVAICLTPRGSSPHPSRADPTEGPEGWIIVDEETHSNIDLAPRQRGGLHRADGNSRVGRRITARRKLAAGEDKDVEELMATMRKEHERAERRLGAALAEQHRSSDRYDAAVGRSARLLAAVGLHAADQEVAARDAWLRWMDDDGYRGLNAGPFELLAEDSGP
jgi:hypothetical protein